MSTLPLKNRTILVTRAQGQTPEFRCLLEEAGARVLEVPTIEIRPKRTPELDSAIQKLIKYDWLIFTSANGVDVFVERARELGKWPEGGFSPAGPRICAIGPATARRVEDSGRDVDLVPSLYQAEGLLREFIRANKSDLTGMWILLPRASKAREILPEQLREKGARVDVIPVYDTAAPEQSRSLLEQLLETESPDLITFTSSSTVHNFVNLAEGRNLRQFRCAVIGPITEATARKYGLDVAVRAEKSSIPDLAKAIRAYFQDVHAYRRPEFEIDPLFIRRWSPRAMSGQALEDHELMALFEAARWAPSSFNNQPWRFLYARRESEYWQSFLDLLVEFNRTWAQKAGALVVIVSKRIFDRNGKPSRTHSLDAGAAWENLALQGTLQGLVVHGMEGFDYDRAREVLEIPDEYEVEAMVAVGKPGRIEDLPERLQQREKPSDRKTLSEIVFEGKFTPGPSRRS